MNRIGIIGVALLALALCVFPAAAGVDDVQFGGALTNTMSVTNSYVVRGEVDGVYLNITPALTCTAAVTLVCSEGILYSNMTATSANNGYYGLLFPQFGNTGSALTFVDGTNAAVAFYAKKAVASTVTAKLVSAQAGTNGNVTLQLNVIK
jgi:hypothetical protein